MKYENCQQWLQQYELKNGILSNQETKFAELVWDAAKKSKYHCYNKRITSPKISNVNNTDDALLYVTESLLGIVKFKAKKKAKFKMQYEMLKSIANDALELVKKFNLDFLNTIHIESAAEFSSVNEWTKTFEVKKEPIK